MDLSLIRKVVRAELVSTRDCFVKDIESTSHEVLNGGGGVPEVRSPYDFVFETAFVNRRFAKLMRGEELEPWPFKTWATAPAEYCEKAAAAADLNASFDEVAAAWDSLSDDDVTREVKTRTGTSTAFELALSAISHGSYHDGQLNYIQTLTGDSAIHWG
jgi:hypothetical protein